MSTIIIVDEDLREIADVIRTQGEETEATVEELIKAYNMITGQLVTEGVVHDNFEILRQEIESLKGQFAEIYEEAGQVVENLLSQVDETDDFLY